MGGCFSKKIIIGCDHNSYSNEVDEDNSAFEVFAEVKEDEKFVDECGFNFSLARPEPVSELQIFSDEEASTEAKEDGEFTDECGFVYSPSALLEPVSELQIYSQDLKPNYNNPFFAAFPSTHISEQSSANLSEAEDAPDSPMRRNSMAQLHSQSAESSLSGDITESDSE